MKWSIGSAPDFSKAVYEAGRRMTEWIKREGNKNDQRGWTTVEGSEVYTNGYTKVEK